MRKAFFVAMIVLCSAASFAGQKGAVRRAVQITAQQVSVSPPAYVFLVTNLSNEPLNRIYVGGAEGRAGIMVGDHNKQTRVRLPSGWTAELSDSNGSGYRAYDWHATDPSKSIKPGESRCDFRVDLPEFMPPKVPQYVGSALYAQVDFDNLPFRVLWPGGEFSDGVIKVHRLQK